PELNWPPQRQKEGSLNDGNRRPGGDSNEGTRERTYAATGSGQSQSEGPKDRGQVRSAREAAEPAKGTTHIPDAAGRFQRGLAGSGGNASPGAGVGSQSAAGMAARAVSGALPEQSAADVSAAGPGGGRTPRGPTRQSAPDYGKRADA